MGNTQTTIKKEVDVVAVSVATNVVVKETVEDEIVEEEIVEDEEAIAEEEEAIVEEGEIKGVDTIKKVAFPLQQTDGDTSDIDYRMARPVEGVHV